MASRNLGALTVDLILELGGFKEGMSKAEREAARASDAFKRVVSEGKRLAESLQTPYEKLSASIARYSALLKVGAISQETFNRAVASAQSTYQKSAGAADGFISKLSSANKLLLGFGVGFSATAIIYGLTNAAKSAIEFGDSINKASVKTGIGAEQISELAYAAKQSDIDLDSLGTALKKMQVNLSETASSGKGVTDTLTALGLTVGQLKALSPDKQFELLADRINALKDPADRTRAAVDLFGKAGADLLPLFEKGAAGIREARDAAHEFGATLTGEQAKALADADDAVKRLKQSFGGLAAQMTAAIAPDVVDFFDALSIAIAGTSKEHGTWMQQLEFMGRVYMKAAQDNNHFLPGVFEIAKAYAELTKEAQDAAKAVHEVAQFPRGGYARTVAVPGFQTPIDKPAKSPRDNSAADAAREAARLLQEQAKAYQDIYTAGQAAIDGLRTPLEEQIDQYHAAKFALEELARTYPNMAAEAEAALKRLENSGLDEIKITAQKIFPKQEQEKLNVFWEEAARNAQGILADFLYDPFKEGIKGMIASFADMLRRMAAQAVAAQIGKYIFGDPATGGGGGFLQTAGKALAGYFGFGGASHGGYLPALANGGPIERLADGGHVDGRRGGILRGPGTATSDSILAVAGKRLIRLANTEYVVRGSATNAPGMRPILDAINAGRLTASRIRESFHEVGQSMIGTVPGFASGGFIGATATGYGPRTAQAIHSSADNRQNSATTVVNQSFSIAAPSGSVSRATEAQIAAAAARGLQTASRRNN